MNTTSDTQITDPGLRALASKGWPFKPGQAVKVKPGDDWKADWQDGKPLYVVGITLDRSGTVRVHVSENWPTDGGSDDMLANDLEPF